ncbi:UNVERIFIED_CONTAM: hypothetical protein FKN15_008842 [Acipenser sinensis]
MAEEYDLKTDELIVRKWRVKNTLGVLGQWQIELGELAPSTVGALEPQLLKVNSSNVREALLYFKKFSIPDMDRCQLSLESSALSFAHANNTLIISYQKPKEILTLEQEVLREVKKMKGSSDGEVDCKTQ